MSDRKKKKGVFDYKSLRLDIEYIPLEEITPYENNPRLNDDSVPFLMNSIREFGFSVPMVLDDDNVIVAGHTRWKAAKELGMKEVPCIRASHLSDEQVKAFRLADNQVGANSGYDFDLLDLELKELEEMGWDMESFAFNISSYEEDEPLLDDLDDDIQTEPEIITEEVEAGSVTRLGRHTVYCMSPRDAMETNGFPSKPDVVIWDYSPLNAQDLARLNMKSTAVLFMTVVPQVLTQAYDALRGAGLRVMGQIPWIRPTGRSEQCGLLSMYQMILVATTGASVDGDGQDVLQATCESAINLTGTKPLSYEAFASLVETFNLREGSVVADFSAMTGSVLIVCEKYGMTCHAVEPNTRYCGMIMHKFKSNEGIY